jgi:excisionase family DNA binding protein
VRHDRTALAVEPAVPDGGNERRLTYTVPEAAALVGISDDSYYRALRAGEVPGLKIRGRYVVPRAALHRYLNGEEGGERDA